MWNVWERNTVATLLFAAFVVSACNVVFFFHHVMMWVWVLQCLGVKFYFPRNVVEALLLSGLHLIPGCWGKPWIEPISWRHTGCYQCWEYRGWAGPKTWDCCWPSTSFQPGLGLIPLITSKMWLFFTVSVLNRITILTTCFSFCLFIDLYLYFQFILCLNHDYLRLFYSWC